MCVARAQLMARARAIDIVCQTDFESGLALSCRKNLSLDDGRLPGGTASGKIKGYNLTLNGDTGEAVATINVGATIGNGGSVGDATGTPTYVDAGYAEEGWQRYSDAATALATADTALADFSDQQPNDDGIVFANLKPSDVVVSVTVFDEADAQQAFIASGGNLTAGDTTYFNSFQRYQSDQEASQQVNEVYTEILLDMIDLTEGGPFESEYTLTVSDLKLPKTIDLEAS